MRIIPLAHWPQDVKYLQIKKADNRYYAFADEKRERIYIPKDWKTNPDIDGYIFHEYRGDEKGHGTECMGHHHSNTGIWRGNGKKRQRQYR